jgi:hypothetical protein
MAASGGIVGIFPLEPQRGQRECEMFRETVTTRSITCSEAASDQKDVFHTGPRGLDRPSIKPEKFTPGKASLRSVLLIRIALPVNTID